MAATPDEVLPRDITQPGHLKNWLVGRVVKFRLRDLDSTAAKQTGKGKKSEAKGSKHTGKGKKTSQGEKKVIELILCGGSTPADVIQIDCWDDDKVRKLIPILQDSGMCIKVKGGLIKPHTSATLGWTTSRLPVFVRADKDTQLVVIDDRADFPRYHPLTSLAQIGCLPEKTLICVAGRVVTPEPNEAPVEIKHGTQAGEKVMVGNANIRNGDDMMRLSFWRDLSPKALQLQMSCKCFALLAFHEFVEHPPNL